jgi:hypothetical protein
MSFARLRLPEFPAGLGEFDPVIVSNLDPAPADAPPVPGPVKMLEKNLLAGGWTEVHVAFSKAYRPGQKTGTYRVIECFGVHAWGHEDNPYRVVAIYWRFADMTETHAWYRDTMALEQIQKASGEPGGWTWMDPRIVVGAKRHPVKATDLKEFAKVRGSVLPGWFAGIARRIAEQASKALCGESEEHDSHTWETATGITKLCSGKATKPKEAGNV